MSNVVFYYLKSKLLFKNFINNYINLISSGSIYSVYYNILWRNIDEL